jgi:hypothetical protein
MKTSGITCATKRELKEEPLIERRLTGIAYETAARKVYEVDAFTNDLAGVYASNIVRQCNTMRLKPHLGGGYHRHKQGKIGELLFERLLREEHVRYTPTCLDRCQNLEKPLHYDYILHGNGQRLRVDVKTGCLKGDQRGFDHIYTLDNFGMLIPNGQIREDSEAATIYVWCLYDILGQRAIFPGWCYRWDALHAPIRDTAEYEGACHQIVARNLYPMSDLYRLLRVDESAESLDKLSLMK